MAAAMGEGDDPVRENHALRARVAELEERLARAEHLADTDPLTPLPNRRAFVRAIERAVAQCARHATPSALLFVDVDGLKRINDDHGHGIGDAALIHVAWLLREKVRAGDTVARLGGDEFGVLLEHTNAEAAAEKAASLRAAIAARPLNDEIALSVAIGVTAIGPSDTPEAALSRADAGMYREKKNILP